MGHPPLDRGFFQTGTIDSIRSGENLAYTRFNYGDFARTKWNNGPLATYVATPFNALSESAQMTVRIHEMSHPGHANLTQGPGGQVEQQYGYDTIHGACGTAVP